MTILFIALALVGFVAFIIGLLVVVHNRDKKRSAGKVGSVTE